MILKVLMFLSIFSCSDIKVINSYKDNAKTVIEDSNNVSTTSQSRTKKSVTVHIKRNHSDFTRPQKIYVHKNKALRSKRNSSRKISRKIASINSYEEHIHNLVLDNSIKHYKFWIKFFTKRDSKRFARHLKNGEKYKDVVFHILKKHKLPTDLFYVGLVESGYNLRIKSRASAVGPWQFIKGTATRYGLRVDSSVDERRNIHKATEAAAKYFKDLYNIFGSWELALCAYNAGEYKIINSIRRGNSRDYRVLVKKGLLPKETIYYVPKVIAARDLDNNRIRYKLPTRKKPTNLYLGAAPVKIYSSFNVFSMGRKLGVKISDINTLNPDLKHKRVRVTSRRPFKLYIPKSKAHLAQVEIGKKDKKYSRKLSKKTHIVRSGDTIYGLANKYRISASQLIKVNKLYSRRIYIGQKLQIPGMTKSYVVRRGDSLNKISRKFKVSVKKLVLFNRLKTEKIMPNQKIYIPI